MNKKANDMFDSLENERSKIFGTSVSEIEPSGEDRDKPDENPHDVADPDQKKAGAYSGDHQGAFSLEKFATSSSLRYTHEDAQGFRDYLNKFNPSNFWYKDSNVRIWAYYEQYDNWQDTYGMDAVKAVYHSGHGGMTNDGKFWVPLGQDWGGQGTNAWSTQMKLGNEQARYIFWSTCVSLRVTGGHSPIRTWNGQPNPGFRMIFGYDSNSVDNKNYGKYFWSEWNKKKSFSRAFMDASWRISTNQRPSVAACGASRDEAKNRVYNERLLYWGSVSHNWWWWRWYFKTSSNAATRPIITRLPQDIQVPHLAPFMEPKQQLRSILSRYDLSISGRPVLSGMGDLHAGDGPLNVTVTPDGSYEVQLAEPNIENSEQISTELAVDRAYAFVRQYGLGSEDLLLDTVGYAVAAGGTVKGSGELVEPAVSETILKFVQSVEGIPVISNETKGSVTIRIDNDGTVTSVSNALVEIDDLRPLNSLKPPTPGEDGEQVKDDPKLVINRVWQGMLKDWAIKGDMPIGYKVIPGSFEVGYAISGHESFPIVRQEIEVDCGGGIAKRYIVEAPLID